MGSRRSRSCIQVESESGNSVKAQAHFRTSDITLRRTAFSSITSLLSTASVPCRSARMFNDDPQQRNIAQMQGAEQLFILAAKITSVRDKELFFQLNVQRRLLL